MAEEILTVAYENGINVFDTAEVYAAGKYVMSLISVDIHVYSIGQRVTCDFMSRVKYVWYFIIIFVHNIISYTQVNRLHAAYFESF